MDVLDVDGERLGFSLQSQTLVVHQETVVLMAVEDTSCGTGGIGSHCRPRHWLLLGGSRSHGSPRPWL